MDPNRHHNALNKNDMLHWYEIISILGQGGFGITYLAKDTNLDQLVAIKEYLPSEFSTRDSTNTVQPISEEHTEVFDWGKKRFLDEAKTLAQFKHPNVVRVQSFFENNNTGYMVMEYEEGTDFSKLIKSGKTFDEARLLELMIPLLDGLETVHSYGFIHRDIKPPNIFIRSNGSPVLIDFGSARQAIGGQTRTMTSLVTPGYAPFEQYHDADGKQGPWTDIYALGATCYSAITGRPPIDALKRGMARLDHSTDAYLSLVDLKSGQYSNQFLQAIDHALEFKEADRPQTVSQWKNILLGQEVVPESEVLTVIQSTIPGPDTQSDNSEKTEVVTQQAVTEKNKPEPDEIAATLLIDSTEQTVDIELTAPKQPTQKLIPKTSNKGKRFGLFAGGLAVLVAIGLIGISLKDTSSSKTVELVPKTDNSQSLDSGVKSIASDTAEVINNTQKAIEVKPVKSEASRQIELAKLAKEKSDQEGLAKQVAEKKQQEELAKKVAEKKRQEILAKQAGEKKRKAAAAKKAAEKKKKALAAKVSIPTFDVSGTYLPTRGYEELVLTQNGNQVSGRVGDLALGNKIEGTVLGNKVTFTFEYSQTGSAHKKGNGTFTVSADGKKLSGLLKGGGFGNGKQWNLNKVQSVKKTQKAQKAQADQKSISKVVSSNLAGSYMPDDGVEVLVLSLNDKQVKGRIGRLGSTLLGEINGNKINFTFMYTKTGYSLTKGTGVFTVSPDGKRLTGIRNKGGFPPGSTWNLTKFSN